jgi:hypothetical protein
MGHQLAGRPVHPRISKRRRQHLAGHSDIRLKSGLKVVNHAENAPESSERRPIWAH